MSEKPTGDMKVLRNRRESRPELSITPYNGQVYGVRATEYGADKYARGNYFGPPPADVDPVDRFAEYISAAQRHLGKIAQAINVAKGTGGDQRVACAVPDDEASGGFPASMLPHIAHAIAGLLIAVECGVGDGLLPADPGQPWKRDAAYEKVLEKRSGKGLPQKDDPDAERERVEALAHSLKKAMQEHEAQRKQKAYRSAPDERVKVTLEAPLIQTKEDAERDMTGKPGAPLDGALVVQPHNIPAEAFPAMRDITEDAFEASNPAWPRGMRM